MQTSLSGQPQRKTSLLLEAQLHPVATAAMLAGMGALALGAIADRQGMQAGSRSGRRPLGRLAPRPLRSGHAARRHALF